MSSTKTDTRLLLATKPQDWDPPRLEIIASPVYVEDGHIRNFSTSGFDPSPLADFQVRALAEKVPDNLGDTWAWTAEYRDVFSVNRERAEVMVKHLRAMDRGMAALCEKFGPPVSFVTYLAYVGSVLKIDQFGWKVSGAAWNYDGNEYFWGGVDLLGGWLYKELKEFRGVPA